MRNYFQEFTGRSREGKFPNNISTLNLDKIPGEIPKITTELIIATCVHFPQLKQQKAKHLQLPLMEMDLILEQK